MGEPLTDDQAAAAVRAYMTLGNERIRFDQRAVGYAVRFGLRLFRTRPRPQEGLYVRLTGRATPRTRRVRSARQRPARAAVGPSGRPDRGPGG